MARTSGISDAAIQHEVRRELEWDTRIAETGIDVAVIDGLVTLTGTVEYDGAKLAAQEAAHRARGVLDVVNDLVVQASDHGRPSDAEIARLVRHALKRDPSIPQQRVGSTVSDGWVMLDGEVEQRSQRDDAERVVRHLPAVQGISNRIVIASRPIDPAVVQCAIEAALRRDDEGVERGETEAMRRISVAIKGGMVTLSGRVESWAEKRAVVGATAHAPGVHTVVDHLRIELSEIES